VKEKPPAYPKGLCNSPTYRSWESMKSRCNGTGGKKNFAWYSSRGITYCQRWEYFANFLEDMGLRPEGKTLDRIDNDKGYCKENCRWATPSQQSRNKRSTSKSGHKHIYYIRNKYRFNIRKEILKYFNTLEEAISARDAYLKNKDLT
jgi:hypothetical protein